MLPSIPRSLRRALINSTLLALGVYQAAASPSATLAWNPDSSPNTAGYVLRYGNSSGAYQTAIDVGLSTTATVSSLTAGATYYFTVTAYDSSGIQSAPSNEASFTLPSNSSSGSPNPSSLVAYYPFEEGSGNRTADATQDGHTASLQGTAWTSGVNGSGALAFNGLSSSATIPPLNLNTNSVTFAAWIKLNGAQQQYSGIVFCRPASNGPASGLNFGSGNQLGYDWNDEPSTFDWNSGLTVPTDVWTFVAMVVTPSSATLYMQPQGGSMSSATNAYANAPAAFSSPTLLGMDTYAPTRYFNGSMDEVRIYNTALSATDIAALANGPAVATTSLSSMVSPWSNWAGANFSPDELANPALSSSAANPTGDGMSNLLKYAFGLPAKIPATASDRPNLGVSGSNLTFTYTRNLAATDVTLTVQESTDLVTWTPSTAPETTLSTLGNIARLQRSVPLGSRAAKFLRVLVTSAN